MRENIAVANEGNLALGPREFDTEDWQVPDGTFSPTQLSDGSFTVPMQAYQGSDNTYAGSMDLTHFYAADTSNISVGLG